MYTIKRKIAAALLICGAAFPLMACDVHEEGHFTTEKIQVAQERYAREFAVDGSHYAELSDIAKHYSRYGDGPLYLTLVYNNGNDGDSVMTVTQKAAEISGWLRNQGGVREVQTDILPTRGAQELSAIVTYHSIIAKAPDCEIMSGYEKREELGRNPESYRLGCTVDTVLSKQISRPKDLLGRDFENTHTDARGVVNQIESARTGNPKESLGGQSTTD